jgi:hypothetical protein
MFFFFLEMTHYELFKVTGAKKYTKESTCRGSGSDWYTILLQMILFFDVIFSDIILHFLELMTALKNEMDLKLNY